VHSIYKIHRGQPGRAGLHPRAREPTYRHNPRRINPVRSQPYLFISFHLVTNSKKSHYPPRDPRRGDARAEASFAAGSNGVHAEPRASSGAYTEWRHEAEAKPLTGSRGAQELPADQLAAPVLAALGHIDLHNGERRCVDPKATSQQRAAMGPLGAAHPHARLLEGCFMRVGPPDPAC
jgi:hypothetical protein